MSREGGFTLLEKNENHPVFHNDSYNGQFPVKHQLALTLERLGSNDNGTSVRRFYRSHVDGEITVVKITHLVITAILSMQAEVLNWQGERRRAKIPTVMELGGFVGCVGSVDGTLLQLHQRPGFGGNINFFEQQYIYVNHVK
ncbi:hypothetical protein K3495_g5916 [Podosphaera aphanis]|nr:hypothetical protein K3495_g5916 [Podosphaera aphanis]